MNSTFSPALACDSGAEQYSGIPAWKRGLDLACIFFVLPALVPLLVLISILIKIVSRGPVFFRQPRIGYQGKSFTIWKFRTMEVDSSTRVHEAHCKRLMQAQIPMTKLDSYGDPRVIPFGAILRSAGLDELPQVFNVFWGEMSLVGPRPCTPEEFSEYIAWQKERFATLPGLTGLWQVNGKNRTTFEQMVRFDIRYVRNRSFFLDLAIMMKTMPVLVAEVKDMIKRRRLHARDLRNAGTTESLGSAGGERTGSARVISTGARGGLEQGRGRMPATAFCIAEPVRRVDQS